MSTTTGTRQPLPAAPARVGVRPGWHISDIRGASTPAAHRLTISAVTGRPSHITLCGRTLVRAAELVEDTTTHHACRDCQLRAARALDPDAPVEPERAPPPPVRRIPAATTGHQDNTVAARLARRAGFRRTFDLSDRAQHYQPRPYRHPET